MADEEMEVLLYLSYKIKANKKR